ncbi:hypothetical protein P691DRAFT_671729 [Macrolepiota fuliginosa MF-IS2]|uniref:G domain-containing protein n=1 Tax=Macrolepiota fuliginosa MF-IS2 TaxID=1400762 RepID=A0A9P5XAA1_9AGAR|nr:hypothetical protein P691DRAFT_671729 [Macrolepiota fuliginosa MF-IS2]
MGPTGTGMTTFISQAIGQDYGDGHSLQSFTKCVSAVRVTLDYTRIVLVDTPGFDDKELSDLEVLEIISDWFKKIFEQGSTLSGLLYMHSIAENRMDYTARTNLTMFGELCGKECFEKAALITTMWPDEDHGDFDVSVTRETELKQKFWTNLIDGGARTLRFKNTQQSAWQILDRLIALGLEERSILIQHELVTLKKKLRDTSAGKQLCNIVDCLVKEQTNVIRRMQGELDRADADAVQSSLAELAELRQLRERTIQDAQALDSSLLRQLRRMFQGA